MCIRDREYYEIQGMKMLLDYLADTSVAPLQRELVETEDPLCGDVRNNKRLLLNDKKI